jgi:WD40 repeat protein
MRRSVPFVLLLAVVAGAFAAGGVPGHTAPAPGVKAAPVWSLAFSPDGKVLAAGSYEQVQLWDAAAATTGQAPAAPLRTLSGHAGPVRCLSWSPDGKQLAAGGGKPGEMGEVRVWDAAGSSTAPVVFKEHRDVVEGIAFASGGNTVLSAGVDEKVLAVDLGTRKVVRAMQDHTNRVVSVAVSPSGKYIATGSLDKTVKIWSGADYAPLANLDNTGGPVYSVLFLPAGEQLAMAGEDGNVRIYRLNESRSGNITGVNGNLLRTLNGNRTPVFALAAAAKGGLLACGGADKTVNVFDLNSGNRKYTLKECADAVYSLAFSPDGALLAAGSRDGKIRLWNTTDGKLLTEF